MSRNRWSLVLIRSISELVLLNFIWDVFWVLVTWTSAAVARSSACCCDAASAVTSWSLLGVTSSSRSSERKSKNGYPVSAEEQQVASVENFHGASHDFVASWGVSQQHQVTVCSDRWKLSCWSWTGRQLKFEGSVASFWHKMPWKNVASWKTTCQQSSSWTEWTTFWVEIGSAIGRYWNQQKPPIVPYPESWQDMTSSFRLQCYQMTGFFTPKKHIPKTGSIPFSFCLGYTMSGNIKVSISYISIWKIMSCHTCFCFIYNWCCCFSRPSYLRPPLDTTTPLGSSPSFCPGRSHAPRDSVGGWCRSYCPRRLSLWATCA